MMLKKNSLIKTRYLTLKYTFIGNDKINVGVWTISNPSDFDGAVITPSVTAFNRKSTTYNLIINAWISNRKKVKRK